MCIWSAFDYVFCLFFYRSVIAKVEECSHPVVMKGLCAECGQDLTQWVYPRYFCAVRLQFRSVSLHLSEKVNDVCQEPFKRSCCCLSLFLTCVGSRVISVSNCMVLKMILCFRLQSKNGKQQVPISTATVSMVHSVPELMVSSEVSAYRLRFLRPLCVSIGIEQQTGVTTFQTKS